MRYVSGGYAQANLIEIVEDEEPMLRIELKFGVSSDYESLSTTEHWEAPLSILDDNEWNKKKTLRTLSET